MWSGWKTCCQMTCQSTATSPCIWQQLLLLVLQRELARLPLREDLLHLSLEVQRLDRVVDLRPQRIALAHRDAFGRNADLFARSLELPARRADVVENGRGVREVSVDLPGLDRRRGARVGRVAPDRDLRLTLLLQDLVLGLKSGKLGRRRLDGGGLAAEGRDGCDVGRIPLLHHQ